MTDQIPEGTILGDAIRTAVREELASLGGHLLARYGGAPINDDGTPNPLGTLGGYLVENYGGTHQEPA
jgi:hypothetical protein